MRSPGATEVEEAVRVQEAFGVDAPEFPLPCPWLASMLAS